MNNVYARFAEKFMAMPVIKGVKQKVSDLRVQIDTHCIEALMQDGKALTSRNISFS
jgi:prolyl-tRNA synthetase